MAVTVIQAEDGWVVIGADNVPLARAVLIETLVEQGDLDNFGVCTEEDETGFCNLKDGPTCSACTDFLNTIFSPYSSHQLTATYWKDL